MRNGFLHLVTGTLLAIALSATSANAQKKYDPGASDTEIKIGQTVPFSGPASAYSSIGKTPSRLFQDDQRCRRHQRPQDQSDPV